MTPLIDARHKPCPEPVIETRAVLAETDASQVTVLVDNAASAENVTSMARTLGWNARVVAHDAERVELALTRAGEAKPEPVPASDCRSATNLVVAITSDRMGAGSDELGEALMKAFVTTLPSVVPQPRSVVFYNAGVHLATTGSSVLDALRRLEAGGVELICCGTCLDYYGLDDQLAVGRVSNMLEIATTLANAQQTVRP